MFICNHCPYVQHVRDELARFGRDYQDDDLGIVAISANDADQYPDDGPDAMRKEALRTGYAFPYLFDADQTGGLRLHVHPRFLLVRRESRVGVPGPVGRFETKQRDRRHRRGSPSRSGGCAVRVACEHGSVALDGLLDQMEAGQCSRLLRG